MDACNCSVRKSPNMKGWMMQADSPKEASTFERMNDRPQLLSSNMTNYFKKWTTASGHLKKYVAFTKFDTSNKSSSNNSCSQKQQYSNKKIKAKLSTPKEQLFGGGSFSEGHPSKCKVYYCSSIKFTLINVVKWQSIFQYMHTWNQGSIIEISVNTLSIRNSWLRVFF